MNEKREQLLACARRLHALGLNRGLAGNVSVRVADGLLITPADLDVAEMKGADMVWMDGMGAYRGQQAPSGEWRFHLAILNSRLEVGAVVHTHSMFATTLACLRREIPPFHYRVAQIGGDNIRCAPYALFGTDDLSQHVLTALRERNACLLANHGALALGADLEQALDMAQLVETLCEQYWRALQVGEPMLLSAAEIAEVQARLRQPG